MAQIKSLNQHVCVNLNYKHMSMCRFCVLCFCGVPPADLQRADLHYLYSPRQITQSARERDEEREKAISLSGRDKRRESLSMSPNAFSYVLARESKRVDEMITWCRRKRWKQRWRGILVWCFLQILALLNTLLQCHGKTPYTLTRIEEKENVKRG